MKLIYVNNYSASPAKRPFLLLAVRCALLLLLMGGRAAAAGYQPDLMVKIASEGGGSYIGAGIYEATAVNQSESQAAFPGGTASFLVLLKNAGDAPDNFLLRGSGGASGFTVTYLDDAGLDRGAAVTGTGYATGTLAPGASVTLLVKVTPITFTPGASYRVAVTAFSASDPSKLDQVKAETVVCSSAAAVTVSSPPDASGPPGGVINYPYTVTNVGNSVNSFGLTASSGGGWPAAIYADDGAGGGMAGDGIRQGGETTSIFSTGPLQPGGSFRFFVAVGIPTSAADGSHADAKLTVTGQGAGGLDLVTTSATAANLFVSESVRNLTQGGTFQASADAFPGDTVQYRMTVTNSGSAAAGTVSIDTPLPQNCTFLPGSVWIGTSAGGDGTPCAQADCGSAKESAGSIVARLGQGATDSAGGMFPPGKTLYVYFRVQVQ